MEAVAAALKSQFHSALAMLKEAIELTPDELWTGSGDRNAPWQVAYHTLFFTHFYLQPHADAFVPWKHHVRDVQNPDAIPGPPDPNSDLPLLPDPYTKEQVRAYWAFCDAMIDEAVDALDLASAESGFSWYPIPKLEHVLVNLRHTQHGAAQLADRVRRARDLGVRWVGAQKR